MKENVCLFFCEDDDQLHITLKDLFVKNNVFIVPCFDEGEFCYKAHKKPTFSVIVLPKFSVINLAYFKYKLEVLESNQVKFALIHPKTEVMPETLKKIAKNEFLFFSGQEIDQRLFETFKKITN